MLTCPAGNVSLEGVLLGSEGCSGQLLSTDTKRHRCWTQSARRDAYSHRRVRNTHGHKVRVVWMSLLTELIGTSDNEALRTEDWMWQYRMMDAMMTALERSLASFTYVP